jgi:Na+/proline symporter
MATNILALGLVIDAIFNTGLTWGVWIGMGIVLAYSVAGGILAGVYTDVFQGTLMAVASVLVFFATLKVGGGMGDMSRSILSADAAWMAPFGKLGAVLCVRRGLAGSAARHPQVLHAARPA